MAAARAHAVRAPAAALRARSCGLKHLHTAGVLHRDLKPSNLLVNADCSLAMADFGLAREAGGGGGGGGDDGDDGAAAAACATAAFTEYVVTRWYRAPEVLLSGGAYSTAVDVWSAGCVLAELLLRRPLAPGANYLHQLQLITELLGSPTPADLHFVRSDAARDFMLRLPRRDAPPLAGLFAATVRGAGGGAPAAGGGVVHLLSRMLVFDPARRISVDDALAHPFLARVRAARRGANEVAPGVPRPFKLKVPGGSAGLRGMTVEDIKQRFLDDVVAAAAAAAAAPPPAEPAPPPPPLAPPLAAPPPRAAAPLPASGADDRPPAAWRCADGAGAGAGAGATPRSDDGGDSRAAAPI
jgi:hypothetical protein